MIKLFSKILLLLTCLFSFWLFPYTARAQDRTLTPAEAKKQTGSDIEKIIHAPQPRITIPGVNFTNPKDIPVVADESGQVFLYIPFLGEYLSAVYRYAVIVAGVIGVIMIIVAGFQWTASGGNADMITRAKKRIVSAVIGIILAVGSYTILYIVNPDLVNFKSLRVPFVKGIALQLVDPKTYTAITGQAVLPKKEALVKAIAAGQKVGFTDPCYMATILAQESGARPNAIGQDSDYLGPALVKARRNFLLSGIKYSRAIFTPPVSIATQYIPTVHNKTDVKNDDKFKNEPPDYGLDWRFSHGFGLGQITLFPDSSCNGQHGLTNNNICFSIPDLLTAEKNLEFTANYFKQLLACADQKNYTGDDKTMAAFFAYNNGCAGMKSKSLDQIKATAYVQQAMNIYNACRQNPNITTLTIPDPPEANPVAEQE